eukprot:4306982-Amphidinium_carterae.1
MVVDACMTGMAVGCRHVGTVESESLGTYNERWRFVAEKDSQPRRRVLEHLGVDSAKKMDDTELLELEHVELLSKDLVEPSAWSTKYRHQLEHNGKEPIHVKEAYASLSAVKHISRCKQLAGKFVIFGDNMSVCLALQRGRSKDYKLLQVVRKVAAHQLSLGHLFVFRWLPSEVNPVDKDSRAFEHGHHSAGSAAKASSDADMYRSAEKHCEAYASPRESPSQCGQEGNRAADVDFP